MRQLPLVGKLLAILLFPYVLLYVLPWESMWASYKDASLLVQILIAVVAAAIFGAAGIANPTAEPAGTGPNTAAAPSDRPDPEPAPDDEPEPEAEPDEEPDPEPEPEQVYPERQDRRERDEEAARGDPITIDSMTATVLDVAPHGSGRIAVEVLMQNSGERTGRISTLSWELQTASGQVLDSAFRHQTMPGELPSADLLPDGSGQGAVYFTASQDDGPFYVLWQPGWGSRSARGIWQVEID